MEDKNNVNVNAGIITIKDTREHLDAMQQLRAAEAEKIMKRVNGETLIDTICDWIKNIVTIAGMVLTVITKFFPGKADDLAVILAQPAILTTIEAARGALKSIFVSKDSKQITAALVDFSGNVRNITIPDKNVVTTVDTSKVKVNQIGVEKVEGKVAS